MHRYPLPRSTVYPDLWPGDCVTFADISGNGYPGDIIIKTRYTDVWAYTNDWREIWHICKPGGYRTAHQPYPIDLDDDGRDEVIAGFFCVNPDGSIRWLLDSYDYFADIMPGHLDAVKPIVFDRGMNPADMRFAMVACGGLDLMLIDGNGNKINETADGLHYESLLILNGKILTNPNFSENGNSGNQPLFIFDFEGKPIRARWGFLNNRSPQVISWKGGADYIYLPVDNLITDENLNTAAKILSPYRGQSASMNWVIGETGYGGDIDGDGRGDLVMLHDLPAGDIGITVYLNTYGEAKYTKLGTGYNYSYY
jgi:hypothetical protein